MTLACKWPLGDFFCCFGWEITLIASWHVGVTFWSDFEFDIIKIWATKSSSYSHMLLIKQTYTLELSDTKENIWQANQSYYTIKFVTSQHFCCFMGVLFKAILLLYKSKLSFKVVVILKIKVLHYFKIES